jgi:hypothetical protein
MATNICFGNVLDVADGGISIKYKDESYVAGPSFLTSTNPYVDYRFNNLTDYSGREKTLIETGVAGASIFTSNGPTTGDGYIQVPVGNTVSTNIAPITQNITIANAAGTGTGMIISFDMKFNGSIPTGDGYVFTLGTPRNGGTGNTAASIGLNFRILDSKLKLSLTSLTGATVTIDYNYANYTLSANTWIRVDVRVPKTLTSSSVTMQLYINGTLMTPSVVDNTTPSLVISYTGGAANNNLLQFYQRGTTQVSNFKIWLSDNLNVLTTVPTTITPVVDYTFYDAGNLTKTGTDKVFFTSSGSSTTVIPFVNYRFNNLLDSSGREKTLVETGTGVLGASTFTNNGPNPGDGYIQVPVGNTVSTNIAPTDQYLTIADATGTGTGMIISFDMRFNGSLPSSDGYIFTVGTPRNGGNGDSAASVGLNFRLSSSNRVILFLTSINSATDTVGYVYNSYTFSINTWYSIVIRVPKTLTSSTVTMGLYINGVLLTPSAPEFTSPSLAISYAAGGTNNNLLRFYQRGMTQVSNFKLWLSDDLNVLTAPSTVIVNKGGPREGDAYLSVPENNSLAVRIQSATIANNNSTGSGIVLSFDMKLNNTLTNVSTPIFTIGSRLKNTGAVVSTLASKGFTVRYLNGYLSYAFVDGFGNYTIYNDAASPANAFSTTAWTRVDIKIPKSISSGIEVYINGELATSSFQGSSAGLEFSSTYDSSLDKTFPVAPVDAPSNTTKQQYLDWFKSISTVMQNVTPATISYNNLGSPAVGTVNSGRSVMLADGRILILSTGPTAASTPRLYTPKNDGISIGTVIVSDGIIGTDLNKYGKGILMKDGRVVFMPNTTFKFCIYAPDYGNLTQPGTYNLTTTPDASPDNGVTNAGYQGGALLPDGRVVCVPFTASHIGIYSPDVGVGSFTRTNMAATGYSSCTLLPDGRVLFVPKGAQRIGLYTPDSTGGVGTFNNGSTPLATNYDGCILLLDGRVLLLSIGNTVKMGIYTPDYANIEGVGAFDNIITPVLPAYTGTISACLLPDGRVLIYRTFVALNNATAWFGIYTPDSGGGTFTFSYPFASAGATQVCDCNITRDGRVIFTPVTSGSIMAVAGSYPTSHEFCIRPFSRSM